MGGSRLSGRAGREVPPLVAPLSVLGVGAAASLYLLTTDPHQDGQWLPRCPFNWLTGLLCPVCGGTRMVYDLLHGDLVAAFHDNAVLLVLGVPVALAMYGRWLVAAVRGRREPPRIGNRGALAVLAVAVVWMVARNVV